MKRNVIFLGLPKTGTMSLTKAFEGAGYRTAHWQTDSGEYVGYNIRRAFCDGERLLHYLSDYDVITQMDVCLPEVSFFPQCFLYRDFAYQYPDALFVLNTRDIASQVKSIANWGDMLDRFKKYGIEDPGKFIYSHNNRVRDFFRGRGIAFLEFDIEVDLPSRLSDFIGHSLSIEHLNKTVI